MAFRDILVPVISIDSDQAALETAASLAAQFEARATAMVLAVHVSSEYAERAQPLSAVLEDLLAGARSAAAQEHERLAAWLGAQQQEFDLRQLTIESAVDQNRIAAHARMADLIVATRAGTHARARQALIEDVLFRSGRPLLLTPEASRVRRFDTIVIGWNASQEAVRAIAGAMPLLQAATKVVVTTVDATPSPGGHVERPGRELADHLKRHGVVAEVRNVDGLGRSHAKALEDDAIAIGADLMVLGAYGHSRAREFVFGGVTRELLGHGRLPLLLSH